MFKLVLLLLALSGKISLPSPFTGAVKLAYLFVARYLFHIITAHLIFRCVSEANVVAKSQQQLPQVLYIIMLRPRNNREKPQ